MNTGRQNTIAEFARKAHRVLPIIDIDTAERIIPTIDALSRGGIKAVEITLRSQGGLGALALAKDAFTDIAIIAGTLHSPDQVRALKDLSVDFAVSPGISHTLIKACEDHELDLLPGICSPSDILLGLEFGFSYFKFFPAEACGGISMLKSLQGPFGNLQFCATGGINPENAKDYLSLSNSFCVGGSWIATKKDIESEDWESIYQKAHDITQRLGE